MARSLFRPMAVSRPGAPVRFDLAAATDSAADVAASGGGGSISGSILYADRADGTISTAIYGPDGVTTLYQKSLAPNGTLSGEIYKLDAINPYTRSTTVGKDVLKPWFAKLANRSAARANVVVIGDSKTAGQGATAQSKRWVTRCATIMRSRLGLAAGGVGFIGVQGNGTNTYTWPGVLSGSPAINTSYGPTTSAATFTTTSHNVFYASVQGTSVDLMLNDANAAVITTSVDAAAGVDQSVTGQNVDGKRVNVSLGSSGAHSFRATWKSGGGVYIDGIIVYDGDENSGLMVHDAGHYGWKSTDWAGINQGTARYPAAIEALSPGVIVISLGANDLLTNTPAQFQAAIQTNIIGQIRARMGTSAPPFVLLVDSARQSYLSAWPGFVSAMYAIAAADPAVTICDASRRIPNVDDSPNYSAFVDDVHPSDIGHGMMADAVASFLLP